MKKLSLYCFLFFLSALINTISAQKAGILWDKAIQSTNYDDQPKDILLDADGSIVVVGLSRILKLDGSGNTIWQKNLGGSINTIIASGDGAYLCTGSTNAANTPGYHAGKDAWAAKVSKNGDVIWSKAYGGAKSDEVVDVVLTSDGHYAFLGNTFSYDGDVQSGRQGRTDNDGWVFKTDMAGQLIWEKCYDYRDSGFQDRAINIVETNDKKLLACIKGSLSSQPTPYYINSPGIAYLINEDNGSFTYFGSYEGNPGAIGRGEPYGGLDDLMTMGIGPDQYYFTYVESTDAFLVTVKISFDGLTTVRDTLPRYASNGIPIQQVWFMGNHWMTVLPDKKYMCAGSSTRYGSPEQTDAVIYYSQRDTAKLGIEDFEERFNTIEVFPGDEGFIVAGFSRDIYTPQSYTWKIVRLVNRNRITGNVFVDVNNNNIKDPGELPYNRITIKTAGNGVGYQSFPVNGVYSNFVGLGTYKTIAENHRPYYTVSPDSGTTVFTAYNKVGTIDIPVHPIPGIKDYAVNVTPLTAVRPGFTAKYSIGYFNYGTDTLHNRNIVFIKDKHLHYLSAIPAYSAISGDTITWAIPELIPDEQGAIALSVTVDPIPLVNLSDTLRSTVYLDSTLDIFSADNIVEVMQFLRGSFDPNDKTEIHGSSIALTDIKKGAALSYCIRFQNTGNDTAFTVIVRDTLDSKLDVSSLEMIASSHPYELTIKDGKYISWTFRGINLLDSIHNEPLSHGYISYQIKARPNAIIGDIIANKAAIYFDFNPAVNTNISLTTVLGSTTVAVWTGTISKAWEEPLNWSNNKVPDGNTAVKVNTGVPNYPEVSSNASCYSLEVTTPATVLVKAGFNLTVKGK